MTANIHVTIFPNLDRFLLIDVRDTDKPLVRVVHTDELLTPEYYAEIERRFTELLRATDEAPFQKLILLPARVQAMLQEHGMSALASLCSGKDPAVQGGQLSVFLCTGSILNMARPELEAAMDSFLQGAYSAEFVARCKETFVGLLEEERGRIADQERDELRRAVIGQDEQFLTLWQDPHRQSPN